MRTVGGSERTFKSAVEVFDTMIKQDTLEMSREADETVDRSWEVDETILEPLLDKGGCRGCWRAYCKGMMMMMSWSP